MQAKLYIIFKNSNIHVTITDISDKTYFKDSCFSNKKQLSNITFYSNLINSILKALASQKISKIFVIISGFHIKRFLFLKDFFIQIYPIKVLRVFYVSKKAYNGCRKKKKRRLLLFLLN